MPKSISIIDWPPLDEKLARLGVIALGNPAVTTIFERERVRDRSLVDRNLTFRGEASIEAVVFNDGSDQDEYRILAPLPKRAPTVRLAPQIALRDGEAWIRYRTDAELTGSADGPSAGRRTASSAVRKSLDHLRFSIDGRAGVTLLDYRRHDPETLVAEAVKNDLLSPRSILRSRDVLDLAPGDALALSTRASLKATVTLSWADIYTNTLTRLTAILGINRAAVRIDSRATLTIPVTVEDDFLFVVSRTDDGDIRVTVRKESADRRSIRARVSISAGLTPPKTIAGAASALIVAMFGVPLDELERILGEASLDDLDEDEREIIDQLIDQLGLTDDVEKLERLRDKLATIEEQIADAIEEVVSRKIRAAVEYEYNRVEESDDLLDVRIRRGSLGDDAYAKLVKDAHRNVIRGDLTPLLAAIADDPERYDLRQYLGRDRLLFTRSYGFTLGIGDWRFGATETTKLDTTTRRDIEGRRMIVFKGLRQHEDQTGAFDETTWTVDFRAAMHDYAAEPRAADFDFGLHFLTEWQIDRFSEKRFLPILDLAMQWRAVPPSDAAWAVGQVRDLFGRRRVTIRLQTIFDEDHLRRILPLVDRDELESIGDALAAALPFNAEWPLLTNPRSRAIAYRDLVATLLRGDRLSRPELHRAAAAIAASLGEGSLAAIERTAARRTAPNNAIPGAVLALHPRLPYAWTRFCEGARLLSEALTTGTTHPARIPEIHRELQRMWEHSWSLRALPAYLLALGDRMETSTGVQRALRIEWEDDDEKRSLVLTA